MSGASIRATTHHAVMFVHAKVKPVSLDENKWGEGDGQTPPSQEPHVATQQQQHCCLQFMLI